MEQTQQNYRVILKYPELEEPRTRYFDEYSVADGFFDTMATLENKLDISLQIFDDQKLTWKTKRRASIKPKRKSRSKKYGGSRKVIRAGQ